MSDWRSDALLYTFQADNCLDAYVTMWNSRYPDKRVGVDDVPGSGVTLGEVSGVSGRTEESSLGNGGESIWKTLDFVDACLLRLVGPGDFHDAVADGLARGDRASFLTGLRILCSCRDWVEDSGVPALPMLVFDAVLSEGDDSEEIAYRGPEVCAAMASVVLASVGDKTLAVRLASLLLAGDVRGYDAVVRRLGVDRWPDEAD